MKHSLADRMNRARITDLSDEKLLVAIRADSVNSARKSCDTNSIFGNTRIQIGAVAQILRDYPEQILFNPDKLSEMRRIRLLVRSLPCSIRKEVIKRIIKNFAQSLGDNAEKKERV